MSYNNIERKLLLSEPYKFKYIDLIMLNIFNMSNKLIYKHLIRQDVTS